MHLSPNADKDLAAYREEHEIPEVLVDDPRWKEGLITQIKGFAHQLETNADIMIDRWFSMPDSQGAVMSIKFVIDPSGRNKYSINYNHIDYGFIVDNAFVVGPRRAGTDLDLYLK